MDPADLDYRCFLKRIQNFEEKNPSALIRLQVGLEARKPVGWGVANN